MAVCLLVRHAAIAFGGSVLAGRTNDPLSPSGEKQARELTGILPGRAVLHSSPRLRCLQTIRPFAEQTHQRVAVEAALDEVDFGNWTGRTFSALDQEPSWRFWNEKRTEACTPNGERMAEVQSRIVKLIRDFTASASDAPIVLVTHAELIRAVALHCRSLSLNDWSRVEIPHASVTAVVVERSGKMVLTERLSV